MALVKHGKSARLRMSFWKRHEKILYKEVSLFLLQGTSPFLSDSDNQASANHEQESGHGMYDPALQ